MRMRTRKQGKTNYTKYWNLPHALYMILIMKTIITIIMITILKKRLAIYAFEALLE